MGSLFSTAWRKWQHPEATTAPTPTPHPEGELRVVETVISANTTCKPKLKRPTFSITRCVTVERVKLVTPREKGPEEVEIDVTGRPQREAELEAVTRRVFCKQLYEGELH
jgi:hypothetical protein